MGGKIIKLDFSKLNLIPRQGGYMIVEQAIIAAFYTQLHSHSVDLYAFRLIPKDGSEVVKLMNGSLVAPYAHIKGKEAVDKYSEEHSPELLDAITQFSKNNYRATRRNNKTILQAEDGQNIALISAPCDKGIIVGGWHNSQGDTDVSKQMLAFVLYCSPHSIPPATILT